MRLIPLVFLALAAGCGEEGPPRGETPAPAPASAAARRPEVRAVRVTPVAAAVVEDGTGARVPAPRPVAVDLVADGWPGRALDPVLEIDGRRFHDYGFPAPGVIRFVVADEALVPPGAELAVQYGDDIGSRRVVRR